jgi:citrate lyase beta subunit
MSDLHREEPNLKLGTTRLRSFLYVPGDDQRKLLRAFESSADAVIVDLEDAVAAERKAVARDLMASIIEERRAGLPMCLVRINPPPTPEAKHDLDAIAELAVDAIVLPKANPTSLATLDEQGPPVLPIIETALGLHHCHHIACSQRVFALHLGAIDLALELRLSRRGDGLELLFARSQLVIESAVANAAPPIDAVYPDFRDRAGLRREARLARDLGMGGKACIHPDQVAEVNRLFSASPEEVSWARRVIKAAEGSNGGAVSIDGEMVDKPIVRRAELILSEAEEAKE